MIFEAELREEIGKGISLIIEGLEDSSSYACSTIVKGLASLGAYCTWLPVSPLLVS
jgi:hypothetical protein